MCKIFAMTNMTQVKINSKFIDVVKNQVCKSSDKDGFGYTVLTKNNKLIGERTTKPFEWSGLTTVKGKSKTSQLNFVEKSSNSFGILDVSSPKSFIAHGRYSTNSVSLDNTHPFNNKTTSLIHNGVVADHGKNIRLNTNCDTEILLRHWETRGMAGIEEHVSGYYAMAILETTGYMHIIRDDLASLYIAYSPTVDSYLIATTIDILKGIAKAMEWDMELPQRILDNSHVVFDGNSIVSSSVIVPRKEIRTMDDTTRIALGTPLQDRDAGYYGNSYNDDAPLDDDAYDADEVQDLVDDMFYHGKRRIG